MADQTKAEVAGQRLRALRDLAGLNQFDIGNKFPSLSRNKIACAEVGYTPLTDSETEQLEAYLLRLAQVRIAKLGLSLNISVTRF
jgi:hypothetical protein